MSYVIADRVQQMTTTIGTGTLTLGSTPAQYQPFATGIGSGNTCDYAITSGNGIDWETGTGTVMVSGPVTTLSRDTIYESSAAGAAVSLIGTSFVFVTITAAKVVAASVSLATGNHTIDCNLAPLQFITNGGAFTIAAPANDGSCILLVTNNATAGPVTFSGFSVGATNIGDPLDTTNGHLFSVFIWRIAGTSGYRIAAHQ